MTEHLHHSLEVLRDSLLDGKLPRSLRWNHAVELMDHLGTVEGRGDNEFVFHVGNARATFKKPNGHELGVEEVSRLRRFLHEAGPVTELHEPTEPRRMIVVIDHHAAHVFRDVGGSVPAEEHTIRPYDPYGFHHHLVHRKEAHYVGERVPEANSFYEAVSAELKRAVEIVIVGHGTGTSSAATYLMEFLKERHPEIYKRVIASEDADLSSVTEAGIEALAKRHMIAVV